MIPDMIPEMQALKWAAHPNAAPPDVDQINSEALAYLLGRHGLTRRFVARALRERPRWCRGVFLASLRLVARDVEAHVRRHIGVMTSLVQQFGDGQAPPIVFKGSVAVYSLTGDPGTMRPSGDIDLLAADPPGFCRFLRGQGYEGEGPEVEAHHEEEVVHRDGITLEVHRGFPVSSYHTGAVAHGLLPREEVVLAGADFGGGGARRILYSDAREDALRGEAPGTEGITIPSPAMLAFLLCCHVSHHLVNPSLWIVSGEGDHLTLRLAEIADICAVVQHPKFDLTRFRELVQRFEGQAALGLVKHLARELLNVDFLPDLPPHQPSRPRLILSLHVKGHALVETTAEALLVDGSCAKALRRLGSPAASRLYDRDLSTTVIRLGATRIDAGHWVAIPSQAAVHSAHGRSLPIQVGADKGGDGPRLLVQFTPSPEEVSKHYHVFAIHTQFGRYYSADLRFNKMHLREDGDGWGALSHDGGAYTLAIALPPPAAQGESLPVLLHLLVNDWNDAEPEGPNPAIVVPFLISWES